MSSGSTARWAALATATALTVRFVRSRRRRSLHPVGRSFAGELELRDRTHPDHYRVTLRLSKSLGTRGTRPDVRGLAIRVHLPGRDLDLLLDSIGHGRLLRHLPMPRRGFDTGYGTITAYRSGHLGKIHLFAEPDPDGPALGRTLDGVAEGDRLVLKVRKGRAERTVGVVTLGRALSPSADAALAFDPVRNSGPDLHPTGILHGVRAVTYRWSQRWRGAAPARANPAAVTRAGAHR
jgi:hypothetical protein